MGWHIHKYEDVSHQTTNRMLFGFAGCELPGQRVVQKCKFCDKIRYISLNLCMPIKYLYMENLWRVE